jgi:hypothetical protein
MFILFLFIGITSRFVGKLYPKRGCNETELFGIASMNVATDYGSIDKPGFLECEVYYWDGNDIPMAQKSSNCTVDEETGDNNMTFNTWYNKTTCPNDILPDYENNEKINNCYEPKNGSISMKAWCDLTIESNLPHLIFYNKSESTTTTCSTGNKLYELWFVPNECFYFDYGEHGDSFSMFVLLTQTYVSPRQYNSTNCDESTEFWREQYQLGQCTQRVNKRRTTNNNNNDMLNDLLNNDNFLVLFYGLGDGQAVIGPTLLVIFLCILIPIVMSCIVIIIFVILFSLNKK